MDTNLLSDMAVFAAVVEKNSFSSAADFLHMSKSSVSRRVLALEKRLQTQLMHRTTRKLGLTEGGRVYYEHCAQLLDTARRADAAVRAIHETPSGLLNVSLPETLGRAFVLPLLPELLNVYPDIRLNLEFTNRKIDLIEDRCDVAIRKGSIEDDSVCAVPLGASSQFLFASPDYVASMPELREPSDLAQHAFLASLPANGSVELKLSRDGMAVTQRLLPRVAVRDHEALLSLTLAGIGIAPLPIWMTRQHVGRGRLIPVLPEWRGPTVQFNAIFQPQRGMAPNLRVFLDFLKVKFQEYQMEVVGPSYSKMVSMTG